MASLDTKFHLWITLFVQWVTWSLSASVQEKGHLYPWDKDDWFRRTTTRSPWERFTFDKFTYFRFTLPTFPTFLTLPPIKFKPQSSAQEPYIWFIVGGVILISLLAMLIRYICANSERDTYDSSPVLHPPPSVIIRPPDAGYQAPPVRPQQQSARSSAPTVPVLAHLYEQQVPQYGVGDRPPNYSEVVMSDFVEEQKKFPGVSTKTLDTPPPKYEDGHLPRY